MFAPLVAQAEGWLEAPDALQDVLLRHVAPRPAAEPALQAIEARRLRDEIAGLLATQGYFSPQIELDWVGDQPRLRVEPGQRALIRRVEIEAEGPVEAELLEALRAEWSLPVGQAFTQQAWSAAKTAAVERLLEAGFPSAYLAHSEAAVQADEQRVDLRILLASGPAYRFGDLRIDGLQRYRPELVQRYNRSVRPGDVYRPSALLELQLSLQNTPYFSAAQVELDSPSASYVDDILSAPVAVRLVERSPHRFGAGIGASSNTGARLELNGGTNDLFDRAWRLNAALRLEQLRQGAAADIFLPPDPDQRLWAFGALRENTDIQGLKTARLGVAARRSVQRGQLGHTLGLSWQQEQRRPDGAAERTDQALALSSAWQWRSAFYRDDLEQGHAAQLQLAVASQALLSDQDFVRAYARYQFGHRLPWGDSLILRAELGRTFASSRQGIPQDHLFRAGGSGSVRGHAYQSLGVQEGSATVGGRELFTASAEYTRWWGEWGAAAFVDAGDAADRMSDLDPAFGYGAGVRWRSPAGPLGLDVARGSRSNAWHLHFALALPF